MTLYFVVAGVTIGGMIAWDVRTRIQKRQRRHIRRRKQLFDECTKLKNANMPYMHIVHRLNGLSTRYDEQGKVVFLSPMFWDIRDSDEEPMKDLGSVIEDLLSWQRIKRKLFSIQKKKRAVQRKLSVAVSRVKSVNFGRRSVNMKASGTRDIFGAGTNIASHVNRANTDNTMDDSDAAAAMRKEAQQRRERTLTKLVSASKKPDA